MVGNQHRLSPLHMGVAGHYLAEILAGKLHTGFLRFTEQIDKIIALIAQIHP